MPAKDDRARGFFRDTIFKRGLISVHIQGIKLSPAKFEPIRGVVAISAGGCHGKRPEHAAEMVCGAIHWMLRVGCGQHSSLLIFYHAVDRTKR